MIKKSILIVLLASALPTAAFADEIPTKGHFDSRVRNVQYIQDEVYVLKGVYRTAMQIRFGENEKIVNIALGDSVSWEIAPSGNSMFLKPREQAGPTNLIVTTEYNGRFLHYTFELSAREGSLKNGTDAVFITRFVYPDRERKAVADFNQINELQQAKAVEKKAISFSLDAAVTQGERNLNYVLSGPQELQPFEVTDNGQYTVLSFPKNAPIPAIFKVLPDGSESIVNYDVRGDFVVIHEVVSQLRLRRGNKLLCIWNKSPNKYGGDFSSGTASGYVERKIKGAN